MNKEDLKIGDYVYYGDDDCYIIGEIKDYDDNTAVIWIDGYYVYELPKNINEYNKLIKDKDGLLCWNFMISVKKLFSKTQSNNKIEFENGSVIQTIKSNDTIRGKGFINNLNDMYNELEDKNFKVGDRVYCIEHYCLNENYKYFIGEIKSIELKMIIVKGYFDNKTPNNIQTYKNNIKLYEQMGDTDEICYKFESLNKLVFKEDIERQQIVDKMEVLKMEIDLALGFKYEKAFNDYVQEYKELEQELNKSEVMI